MVHIKTACFFYQTLNGGFRYQDISTMFKLEFPIEFSYKPRNAEIDTDKQDLNSPTGLNTQILAIEKTSCFRYHERYNKTACILHL